MKKTIILYLLFVLTITFSIVGCSDPNTDIIRDEIHKYTQLYLELLEPIAKDNKKVTTNDTIIYIRGIEKTDEWLEMQTIINKLAQMEVKEDYKQIVNSVIGDNNHIKALIEYVQICDNTGATTLEEMTADQQLGLDVIIGKNKIKYMIIYKNEQNST